MLKKKVFRKNELKRQIKNTNMGFNTKTISFKKTKSISFKKTRRRKIRL